MLSKPNNMSRRGFLRNVLGITAAIILPAKPVVAEYGPSILTPAVLRLAQIRGLSRGVYIYDEVQDLDFEVPIEFKRFAYMDLAATPSRTVIWSGPSAKVTYWPDPLPLRDSPYKVKV